jgi:hypothetical protein
VAAASPIPASPLPLPASPLPASPAAAIATASTAAAAARLPQATELVAITTASPLTGAPPCSLAAALPTVGMPPADVQREREREREERLVVHLIRGALPLNARPDGGAPSHQSDEPDYPPAHHSGGRGRGCSRGRDAGGSERGGKRASGRALPSEEVAAHATALAIANAVGAAQPARPPSLRPPPSAFECCLALELLAASRGWAWTIDALIRRRLLPLLREGGGRSSLLRLLGKLGGLAPSTADPDVIWLCGQLREHLESGQGRLTAAETASVVSSLLELLPTTPELSTEAAETVGTIARWLSKEQVGWQGVPPALRDRYHEAARRLQI